MTFRAIRLADRAVAWWERARSSLRCPECDLEAAQSGASYRRVYRRNHRRPD